MPAFTTPKVDNDATATFPFGTVVVNANGQKYVEPPPSATNESPAGAVADIWAPNPNAVPTWRCASCSLKCGLELNKCLYCKAPRPE